jgi:para-aminobenzoate synthetase component 1
MRDVAMPRLTIPGPAITWTDALTRVADAVSLVCLRTAGGDTLVAGDAPVIELRSWADLVALPLLADGDEDPGEAPGWHPRGAGWAVQLDYEFPATPGRAWKLDAYARWSGDGPCTLHASDAAGLARLAAALARPPRACPPPTLAAPLRAAWDGAGHAERVERIRALIAAGDLYQANLTLPIDGRLREGPHADLGLFLALCAGSPAPYAALLRAPGRPSVVSNSPECFLRQRGARVTSEPIKGTRRRSAGHEATTRAELLASAKDRAELAMIVDLVRNDLGRVAEPGSVAVEAAAEIVDLPYVHHLVARVAARLRPDRGVVEALRAAFPAGSITGAPKIRAMQVISAIEAGPRGPYCGTLGWLGAGHADLAVAIRVITVAGEAVRLHAGGGIVADSAGAAEWDEVRAKAAAMATALGGEL